MTDVQGRDQEEFKAKLLLKDLERRTRFLEAASRKPNMAFSFVFGVLLMVMLIVLGDCSEDWSSLVCLSAASFILFALIEGYNRATNRRIDAVMALLQEDNLMSHDAAGSTLLGKVPESLEGP